MKRRGVLKSIVAVAAVVALSAVAAAPASAITSGSGRIFILSDIGGARGDLFRSTPSNTWKRLTFGLSFPENVSADPGGKFAVLCARKSAGGLYRIYRVSANGGRLKNLIGSNVGCGPTVSPDGRKVAYLQGGATNTNLRIVNSKGGKPRTIYTFCSGCIYQPVWAGKRIYFERRTARNFSADLEIYSVRAKDGRGLRRHTNDGGAPIDYELADVSPDGRRILAGLQDSSGSPRSEMVLLSAAGAEVTTLVSGSTFTYQFAGASFSPSGRQAVIEKQEEFFSSAYSLLFDDDVSDPTGFLGLMSGPAVSGTNSFDGPYSIDWVRR